ncbi:tRNA (adenosine(37)-N6)-threonylcarbamoyltransferase complex transferase subunit TsaD [Telmatospirillum sp.]|uniref:tRNA (adenosine(37)-N6)-threonylcarbamoyltransferase complex transferase subunit TsaD n=1 Tax=Telmatospirillum sp. TaxID=2079197 RepID=UPI00284A6D22|nr:tRNA (adenosine(37)-N6)-threonylcarbamoyltransferase complex transferase subunit TsaD [Telmatospirillum sp.]MDR3439559.1 tRNA (adenosine(37)-N6)-threonylcarbamoyltransferase complex transferase subunit TsaD [Telmatospirillum sp.]
MIVLGIESSCDETAAAVVRDDRTILADVVLSQLDEHRPYGGVVPEIAARSHLDHLDHLVAEALARSGTSFADMDAIAATGGPGLIGGVMVGVMTAKAIAAVSGKPFVAVNHLEGHALTARLTEGLAFPYLLLLVSGGHCQLLTVEGVGHYRRLGATIDDAAGEAFDKVAKMLDLGYPGGPAVQQAAAQGDVTRFSLPRPMKGRPGCDFSFSGLKNAVRLLIAEQPSLSLEDRRDIAAAFQIAVADAIADRTCAAMGLFAATHGGPGTLVVAGGVAANALLRETLAGITAEAGFRLAVPPQRLCTDNAAMIAWAGLERFRLGQSDGLDFAPRPRWPLDPQAKQLRGAGVKA